MLAESSETTKPINGPGLRVRFLTTVLLLSMIVSASVGGTVGYLVATNPKLAQSLAPQPITKLNNQQVINEESSIISAVEKVNPAVVSIVISKDLPIIERRYKDYDPYSDDPFDFFFGPRVEEYQSGTQKQEVGGGSGFIVSEEGMIVTNKHVVEDETASYTVLTNDGQKLEGEVLARHPSTDLAILKVKAEKKLPYVELGSAQNLKLGQLAIAIGNALAEFRNTVSLGVISGLSRSITAGGYGSSAELLENVIQTDAAINPGNSGGPLVNLQGQVIGVNTAIISGAQNIGFAIPVEVVKQSLESVQKNGKITRPFLGVRYNLINEEIKRANNLSVDYGAIIIRGETKDELAVMPGSPADKAGLEENDIILEVNGEKVDQTHSLATLIGKYNVGDNITLKIMHEGNTKTISVQLGELE